MSILTKIQSELKAPKSQFNAFGKYHYRNLEDILEALKPLLAKYDATLIVTDEIHQAGNVIYCEATAILEWLDGDNNTRVSTTAQAGIDINRKGMDVAQSFGASSSYARKYAVGGLFLIDDTKDADATNTHDDKPKPQAKPEYKPAPVKQASEPNTEPKPSSGNAGDVEIHFGKNIGKRICELSDKQLDWYINEWDATSGGKYKMKPQDKALKDAMIAYRDGVSTPIPAQEDDGEEIPF